jgi:hypothetical protein
MVVSLFYTKCTQIASLLCSVARLISPRINPGALRRFSVMATYLVTVDHAFWSAIDADPLRCSAFSVAIGVETIDLQDLR